MFWLHEDYPKTGARSSSGKNDEHRLLAIIDVELLSLGDIVEPFGFDRDREQPGCLAVMYRIRWPLREDDCAAGLPLLVLLQRTVEPSGQFSDSVSVL